MAKTLKIVMVAGSQPLYGKDQLALVEKEDLGAIIEGLNAGLKQNNINDVEVVSGGVLACADTVTQFSRQVAFDLDVIGVVNAFLTFSPGQFWRGLKSLSLPLLHFHTQRLGALPWRNVDMNHMNRHQVEHGALEGGFALADMGIRHETLCGHWQDPQVIHEFITWVRAVRAIAQMSRMTVIRIGHRMNAVTDTDIPARRLCWQFGPQYWEVPVTELENHIRGGKSMDLSQILKSYQQYKSQDTYSARVTKAAEIELGLRSLLQKYKASGFTDSFEDLGQLDQLSGIGVQRLMAEGVAFGPEGDIGVMTAMLALIELGRGLAGGCSLAEPYVADYREGNELYQVLAHMLEVSPSITDEVPFLQVEHLGIGGKNPPARLVFSAKEGPGILTSLTEMDGKLRLVTSRIDVIKPLEDLASLPVANIVCKSSRERIKRWHELVVSHHMAFSNQIDADQVACLARILGIEHHIVQ